MNTNKTEEQNVCDEKMSFEECELAILRVAMDKAEEKQGRKVVNSPEIRKIIGILEKFIRKKKLVVYGGTAVNNILPKKDQFYNKDIALSDYDFFSVNALDDAKELADIYVKEGFPEVEAKAGQHYGTYKVFVDFVGIADITYIHKEIYKELVNDAIKVDGILYAPANFLRMSMYLELSRPDGDISRWDKILKRITLLNKHYPLKGEHCSKVEFQRSLEDVTSLEKEADKKSSRSSSKSEVTALLKKNKSKEAIIFDTLRSTFINQSVVFFGGYSLSLYSHYMPEDLQHKLKKVADFDVLAEDPEFVANIVKERLEDEGFTKVTIVKRDAIGEIVAPHYQIMIKKDTVAFIYKPIACHSYNMVKIHGEKVKIATIDTILSFYLAFLYSGRNYYDVERILCMAQYLFDVQQKNRLIQKGLLKRFSIQCYGKQDTLETIRAEKAEKFKELKDKKNSEEYHKWFLRYRPLEEKEDRAKARKEKQGKQGKQGKKTKKTGKKKPGNKSRRLWELLPKIPL